MKKIFKYLEPAWTGDDGKFSLRSALAIVLSINLIVNVNHAIWRWDSQRSLEGLALVLGIEAGLIAGLLALKTYQNTMIKPVDNIVEEIKEEEIK